MWKGSHQTGKTFSPLTPLWGNLLISVGQAWPKSTLFQTALLWEFPFYTLNLAGKVGTRILKQKLFGQESMNSFPHIRVDHTSMCFRDSTNVTALRNNGSNWIMITFLNLPLCVTQGFLCPAVSQIENKMKLSPILSTFFALSQGFAAPLGCRLSYLKPVMTPLYSSEWLICSLKECQWARLIGTWIFLKDVTGSGMGNITHNVK